MYYSNTPSRLLLFGHQLTAWLYSQSFCIHSPNFELLNFKFQWRICKWSLKKPTQVLKELPQEKFRQQVVKRESQLIAKI